MLRLGSTTDSAVVGRTPVPRHDGQRPILDTAKLLEDLDERSGDGSDGSAVVTAELGCREVRAEVTHHQTSRVVGATPRRRCVSKASSTHPPITGTVSQFVGENTAQETPAAARPAESRTEAATIPMFSRN